jgi:hypothetical protein
MAFFIVTVLKTSNFIMVEGGQQETRDEGESGCIENKKC